MSLTPPRRESAGTKREPKGLIVGSSQGAVFTNSMVPWSVSTVRTILSRCTVTSHLPNAAVRPGCGDVLIVSLSPSSRVYSHKRA